MPCVIGTCRELGKTVCLSVLLSFTLPSQASSQLIKMTVATGGVNPGTSLPFIAEKENLFAKHGLDIKIVNAPTPAAVQGMLSGTIHALMSFGGPALPTATLEGAPPFVLVSSWVSVFPYRIMSRKEISSAKDLKGKVGQIGVPFGTAPHVALTFGLAKLGLDAETDVKLVQMPKADWASVLTQLERGDVDFAPFPPPYDLLAERRGFHQLISLPEMGIPWTQNGEWVQKSYLAKNRDAVLRLLRVVSDSMKTFFGEKQKTVGYLSEFLGTNREDAEYAYQLYLKWAERNPRPKVESVRSLLESIKKTTPKAASADPTSFIDVSVVDELTRAGYFK
jgi:ABC-type nitrate/sulfonate/bicarbonate transport system substrate-binding protein